MRAVQVEFAGLSLGNLHVEIDGGDEEGLGEELRRGKVRGKLRNGLHATMMGLEGRMGLEDALVVAEGEDALHLLE